MLRLVCVRTAAVLLVTALLAPAIAAALCDVTCVRAHEQTAAAGEESCHAREHGAGTAMTSAAAPFCHTTTEALRATLAPAALNATLAVAVVPAGAIASTSVAPESTAHGVSRRAPPDPLLLSTQLRI
jgi:hypothetical protein